MELRLYFGILVGSKRDLHVIDGNLRKKKSLSPDKLGLEA